MRADYSSTEDFHKCYAAMGVVSQRPEILYILSKEIAFKDFYNLLDMYMEDIKNGKL